MSNAGRVPLDIEQEKAELQAVLSSKLLAHAPSLSKLLLHICNKHFSGEVGQIKEYTIAVEIFNRPADFQSREDSIVRVEANRLREKLKKYYRTEGLNHRVWISIPPGQYGPVFEYKQFSDLSEGCASSAEDAAEATNSASTETGHGAEVPGCEQGFRIEPGGAQSPKGVLSQRYVLYFVAFLVGVLALAITGFITLSRDSFRSISTGSTKTLPSVAVSSPVPKVPEGPELRIMPGCGREGCVDRIGNQWLGDRYFKGGEIFTASETAVLRADDSSLCRKSREGDFTYDIPLNPGIYELHLYFAEMLYGFEPEGGGEASRIFNVFANGNQILQDFDVLSDAEGSGRLSEKVFIDISPASDGYLHLAFASFKGKAMVNGLEILPGIPKRLRPVRITTRNASYLSTDQRLWGPDRFFRGGRTVQRLHPVEGTDNSELYQNERFGHFSYTIPVVSGKYQVVMKFAETYFGPKNAGGGGVNSRLFDVYCNDQPLLKDFCIFKAAGGENRALDMAFHGLQGNAQGKLILHFVPSKNYACVNAIEIIPE